MIIILSGISGVGKTTIAEELIHHGFKKIVSCTTRQPREGEIHGKDYHFISKEEFQKKLNENFFFEHTEKFENYYGISFESIENSENIVMCLCSKGYLSAKTHWPEKTIGFYLLPPGEEELIKRLKLRNDDQNERRLQNIKKEIAQTKDLFDYQAKQDTVENMVNYILEITKNVRK